MKLIVKVIVVIVILSVVFTSVNFWIRSSRQRLDALDQIQNTIQDERTIIALFNNLHQTYSHLTITDSTQRDFISQLLDAEEELDHLRSHPNYSMFRSLLSKYWELNIAIEDFETRTEIEQELFDSITALNEDLEAQDEQLITRLDELWELN